ncbi:MAG: hypothetical protein JWN12_343 [Candidatus Saccharibacteria bacterium]|nr:hypothetical protein [Candidatus Saccharibacteria bacterium]
MHLHKTFKKLSVVRQAALIIIILAVLGVAPTYAATDGFCTSPNVSAKSISNVSVETININIKTDALDIGQTKSKVTGKNGITKETYNVVTHCGVVKSKTLISSDVIIPVINGETLVGTRHNVTESSSVPFNTVTQDDPNSYVGTNSTITEGIDGTEETIYTVAQNEGQAETKTQVRSQVTIQPTNKVVSIGSKKHEYVNILTYPVAYSGQYATLTANTLPSSTCNIVVNYYSGPSTAAGLYTKTSDGNGNIQWSWIVGTRTSSGSWPITVTCSSGLDNTASGKSIIQVN